ncbi:MAG: OPA family glycerol-3-phosphate transporter-like MFS transporter [Verrucomicrobiales bacterium]
MAKLPSNSRTPFTRPEAGVLWVLWLTYGSFYFCRANISAAVPGIQDEFDFDKAQTGLILGGLKLAYGFGQLINGQLAEKISPRKLLTVGMLISALLNVVIGFWGALYFLIFIWACNGYFQALGWTPCMRVAGNWFPVEKRGRAIGIIGTGYQATAALTFVVAGFSAQWFGWRGAFYIPAILFGLSCIHMLVFLKEKPPNTADPTQAQFRPASGGTIGHNILVTLTNPWLWFLALSLGLLNACRYGFLDWGLDHLIDTQGGGIGNSAIKYAVLPLGGIAGALLSGWVTDRWFGGRAAPAIMCLLLALGVLTLIYSKVVVPGGQGYDLRLISEAQQPENLPDEGEALVIISQSEGTLHFRVFDEAGSMVANTGEAEISSSQEQTLKRLKKLLGKTFPTEISERNSTDIIGKATSLVGHTQGSVVLPIILLALIGFCIFGPQVLLVGTAPMDLARGGAIAAAVGFVNFLGYMGAFSGDYVTGHIVDDHGWQAGLKFWAGCAFAAAIISAFLWNRRSGERETTT